MMLNMLKGKIHRATVVQAEVDYIGSITIDQDLMDAAGILEYEKVQVADVDNGNRLETYVIAGEPGSGMICLNGAAARYVELGDKVIIMCYAQMDEAEARFFKPNVVFVDDDNKIARITRYEKHGRLEDLAYRNLCWCMEKKGAPAHDVPEPLLRAIVQGAFCAIPQNRRASKCSVGTESHRRRFPVCSMGKALGWGRALLRFLLPSLLSSPRAP